MKERRDLQSLEARLESIGRRGYLEPGASRGTIVTAWEGLVERFLEDGELSQEEESEIAAVNAALGLGQHELDGNGMFTRMVRAGAIRDTLEGKATKRLTINGGTPFLLQKNEALLWAFTDTEYLEDRTRREYRGGSVGGSVRVMKGVYFRTSSFRGYPVDTVHRVSVDTGMFGVTNRHIYFVGPSKSLRVRHDKIVSLTPFSDGIGIHRDAQTAKPQIFITGDGWFTYNLVANARHVST